MVFVAICRISSRYLQLVYITVCNLTSVFPAEGRKDEFLSHEAKEVREEEIKCVENHKFFDTSLNDFAGIDDALLVICLGLWQT